MTDTVAGGRPHSFFALLQRDLRAKARHLYGVDDLRALVRALAADGSSAVILFRISQALRDWHLSPAAWLMTKLNKLLNGVTIGAGARIAPGFVIQHSVGVVINTNAVLGEECILEGGVVIGASDRRSPTIADHVYIGSGACVIGGVSVGAGSKIGANAVVVKDIAPKSTVVGIPAREL